MIIFSLRYLPTRASCGRPPDRLRWRIGLVVRWGLLSVFFVVSGKLLSQQTPCDPGLPQDAGNPHGYHLRGDRCEGIYIRQVSGNASLAVVSVMQDFEDYSPENIEKLRVTWAPPVPTPVRLRAFSLRPKLYYRMDADRPAGTSNYEWPSGLLHALGITKKDLGVVGWIRYSLGGNIRDIYLPLRINAQPPTPSGKLGKHPTTTRPSLVVLILPDVELKDVFVSLVKLGRGGSVSRVLRKNQSLNYGYYPADRPIAIPIQNLNQAGFYHMEIGALVDSGGSTSAELWFYHAGS